MLSLIWDKILKKTFYLPSPLMIHGMEVFITFYVPFLFLLDVLAMSVKRFVGIADARPSLMEFCITKKLMEYFGEL